MPKWKVTIKATITKTISDIEADTEDEAVETAHSLFTIVPEEGVDEDYEERMEDVERIDEPDTSDEGAETEAETNKSGE
jgi:hypothetical protein